MSPDNETSDSQEASSRPDCHHDCSLSPRTDQSSASVTVSSQSITDETCGGSPEDWRRGGQSCCGNEESGPPSSSEEMTSHQLIVVYLNRNYFLLIIL